MGHGAARDVAGREQGARGLTWVLLWMVLFILTLIQLIGGAACTDEDGRDGGQGTAATAASHSGADVEHVVAALDDSGTWTFSVTVSHPDTGEDHYADGWDVVAEGGEILKPDPQQPFTRPLLHPHVDEQPFTRSQSGIEIPEGVGRVRVRAHDSVHGFGGAEIEVDLSVDSGPGFEVRR